MPHQRKLFRIEEMYLAAAGQNAVTASDPGPDHDIVRDELDALLGGADESVERILTAAEDIDEAANTLMILLAGEQDQEFAHAIRRQVARIFEACTFHDLANQRIAKVRETLRSIDARIAGTPDGGGAGDGERLLVNGPKLDGAPGHVKQSEIDTLFD
jgi:chemotaxis protein CheZ